MPDGTSSDENFGTDDAEMMIYVERMKAALQRMRSHLTDAFLEVIEFGKAALPARARAEKKGQWGPLVGKHFPQYKVDTVTYYIRVTKLYLQLEGKVDVAQVHGLPINKAYAKLKRLADNRYKDEMVEANEYWNHLRKAGEVSRRSAKKYGEEKWRSRWCCVDFTIPAEFVDLVERVDGEAPEPTVELANSLDLGEDDLDDGVADNDNVEDEGEDAA